jgi:hypothetical protein
VVPKNCTYRARLCLVLMDPNIGWSALVLFQSFRNAEASIDTWREGRQRQHVLQVVAEQGPGHCGKWRGGAGDVDRVGAQGQRPILVILSWLGSASSGTPSHDHLLFLSWIALVKPLFLKEETQFETRCKLSGAADRRVRVTWKVPELEYALFGPVLFSYSAGTFCVHFVSVPS